MATVSLTINGKRTRAEEGQTVLQVARAHGVNIPTLCNREDLTPTGACRLCVVEVAGARALAAACALPVSDGMEVRTHSPRVREARETIIKLLLANHPNDCLVCSRNGSCELQQLASDYGISERAFEGARRLLPVDVASASLERDPNKCVLCGRCVKVCEEVQGVGAIGFSRRGFDTIVAPAFGQTINETACVLCGQCALACPTGALRERSAVETVWDALGRRELHTIVQVAPAVRASLGEELGLPPGTLVTGQMVAALRRMGFDRVFSTNWAADLTVMEEGSELVERLKSGGPLPLLTSCSPGWIKFIEHFYPQFLPNLSTCKSPQQMFGAIAKSYYAESAGIDPENIYVVSVMPCTAKKFEATRPEMRVDGLPEVDAVLTTRELARMFKMANLEFAGLEPEEFDLPLGISTGAADIFGATGGVMEAALRSGYYLVTGKELADVELTPVRGLEGCRKAEVDLEGLRLKVAVTCGLANARALLDRIASGQEQYHFVEIMACPAGCISGGGQPRPTDRERIAARARALYEQDRLKPKRQAHQNPVVLQLYREYLGEPLGEKSHHLLHTHYTPREAY